MQAGIPSVGTGQWEAARALGLHDWQIIRLVVLPQALRASPR
ncbi:ABC transporter permease subunit [Sinorhizobium americanum]|nr:ABC transporter permease subunit [Sinorhizobium americanum]